jgi:hypothetical protein
MNLLGLKFLLNFWHGRQVFFRNFPKKINYCPTKARYYSRKQVELSTILTPSQALAKLVSKQNHPNSSKSTW